MLCAQGKALGTETWPERGGRGSRNEGFLFLVLAFGKGLHYIFVCFFLDCAAEPPHIMRCCSVPAKRSKAIRGHSKGITAQPFCYYDCRSYCYNSGPGWANLSLPRPLKDPKNGAPQNDLNYYNVETKGMLGLKKKKELGGLGRKPPPIAKALNF